MTIIEIELIVLQTHLVRIVCAVFTAADRLGLEVAVPLAGILETRCLAGDRTGCRRFFAKAPFAKFTKEQFIQHNFPSFSMR